MAIAVCVRAASSDPYGPQNAPIPSLVSAVGTRKIVTKKTSLISSRPFVTVAATMASPAATLDADAVAAYLLDRRHLLSAFELYQDLASPPAASTKDGGVDDADVGDVRDARAKLEAFFGDQKRFPLSDVRAHADAVDGAPT